MAGYLAKRVVPRIQYGCIGEGWRARDIYQNKGQVDRSDLKNGPFHTRTFDAFFQRLHPAGFVQQNGHTKSNFKIILSDNNFSSHVFSDRGNVLRVFCMANRRTCLFATQLFFQLVVRRPTRLPTRRPTRRHSDRPLLGDRLLGGESPDRYEGDHIDDRSESDRLVCDRRILNSRLIPM